ncbi:hypothetical protein [Nocardia arizonensis]|uniref:hypothetical protein n=1 Tax=Nocardia arizonensis TaxID=1141647 RepID=UPI0006CFF73B|nr:hypothetical protein [Nocardia arizonensis]
MAIEASVAVLYAAVTLPLTSLDAPKIPDWVSLSGLAIVLLMIALNLHTWRVVVTGGLTRYGVASSVHPVRRLEDQLRDERRLRTVAASYLALPIALLPVPATWVTFWFAFTVATACLAASSLLSLVYTSARRTREATGAS